MPHSTVSACSHWIRRPRLSRPSVREIVEEVRRIPYRRNVDRSAQGVLAEGVGTCSTKHALLVHLLADRPELDVRLVHRVYRVDRESAHAMFGSRAAEAVPDTGLIDVHTYATFLAGGHRVRVDVTFPRGPSDEPWDGSSDMTLACGVGDDFEVPAGADPWEVKDRLVAEHCDPAVREPFIRSLFDVSDPG